MGKTRAEKYWSGQPALRFRVIARRERRLSPRAHSELTVAKFATVIDAHLFVDALKRENYSDGALYSWRVEEDH